MLQRRTPAKLNLALRVLRRRQDGYHDLQTVFQLIDLCDEMHLSTRQDGQIHLRLQGDAASETPTGADNLVLRAAELLRRTCGARIGADITLHKTIPVAAGLGGGSSDAACALLGLNSLWRANLSRRELMALALQLGADVPLFVLGRNAFAEGIGERLTPICLPHCHYLVVIPPVQVRTGEIFARRQLTADSHTTTISRYLHDFCGNDLEELAMDAFPVLRTCKETLSLQGKVRMSGSGAALFLSFADGKAARQVQDSLCDELPDGCRTFCAQALAASPSAQATTEEHDGV